MSWPHSWIIWRCRNVRTEFALLWLLPLWQRPVHLLPCYLPSWMSTAFQSWMCRTACSSPFPSFSSILEKWAKITFTQWRRCWRTLSWTGEWKDSWPHFILLIFVSTLACFPTEALNVRCVFNLWLVLLEGEMLVKPDMYKNHNWVMGSYTACIFWPGGFPFPLVLYDNYGTMLTCCLCDLAETWSTDRRPVLWCSTCLWGCTASAAKIPSTTSWTMCGPTCLRRRLTSSRLSWEPWKDWGLPSGPVACCSTAYR